MTSQVPDFLIDSTSYNSSSMKDSSTSIVTFLQKVNVTSDVHNMHDELFYLNPPANYILATIFGFLIIVSVIGNFMVLVIIVRFKRMRTRTNLLLANLSAIDLLTGLLTMPFSMITAFYGDWVLGPTACQINGFLNALFISASIHTLMYISIHKYLSIRNVFKTILGVKHIIGMMAATWIWGLLFATGLVAGWTHIEYKVGTTQCGPKVPDRENIRESTHSVFTSVSNFVIPLAVIIFCYAAIFLTFRRHLVSMGEIEQSTTISLHQHALIQQKKIAVTLIIVLICFLICLLPYIVYSSTVAFAKNKLTVPKIFNPLAYIFLYLASCVNPFIYALRSEAFRIAYKNFFLFLCCQKEKKKSLYRRNIDHSGPAASRKSGWRRVSAIIFDVVQLGVSRETLSSRRSSIFAQQHIMTAMHHRPCNGLIHIHHPVVRKADSGDTYLLAEEITNNGKYPPAYRPQASVILEERTSQIAGYEKNPETDSGKAESDGEGQDPQESQPEMSENHSGLALVKGHRERHPLLATTKNTNSPNMSIDFV